jgi:hypothetical protein
MLISLAIAVVAVLLGYNVTRRFVRDKLRFVDAVVESPLAPVVAAIVAVPLLWALPFIGLPTALIAGASVGVGVAHGSKDARGGGGSWEVVSTRDS